MKATIRTENGFYNSIVFAIVNRGWGRGNELLVFNQDYTALQFVNMSRPKINALIYNIEQDENWIIKKKFKFEGYSWVLEKITKKFSKIILNDIDLNKCKALQATVENSDWFEIKNKADISGLIDVAHGFFNARVRNIYFKSDKEYISFDTTWGYDILFELDGNIETNLIKGFGATKIDNELHIIFNSTIFIENNSTYWVSDETVKSSMDLDKTRHYYFCANQIKWKIFIQKDF